MENLLIVSGHPDLNDSFANKTIMAEFEKLMPKANYVYLDRLYPDFEINKEEEQAKLIGADIIVLQFPFFWYGVPSLMSRWIEEVFVHGFSHGATGDKVKGKKLLVSFTSGAPEEMYAHGGLQNYPIEELIVPLKQFANMCQMEWAGHVYSGGLSYASRDDENSLKQMESKSIDHARRVMDAVKVL